MTWLCCVVGLGDGSMVVNTPCSLSVPRPDLDQAREDMVDRAQRHHNERVSDHSYTVRE